MFCVAPLPCRAGQLQAARFSCTLIDQSSPLLIIVAPSISFHSQPLADEHIITSSELVVYAETIMAEASHHLLD